MIDRDWPAWSGPEFFKGGGGGLGSRCAGIFIYWQTKHNNLGGGAP